MDVKRYLINLTLAVIALTPSPMDAAIVKGTVYNHINREPLVGATIIAIPDGNGTSTDIDGNYLLSLNAGEYSFSVRYIGYRDTSDNWMQGWTNFDPQNNVY